MSTRIKLALIQMLVGPDKSANISKAAAKITEAAAAGATLIMLPESFNSPYGHQYFREYAENIPGPTTDNLTAIAKKLKICLIGGSLPEDCSKTGKLYNTCPIINTSGNLVGKFQKVHLFDIDVPGKMTFKESDSLAAGNEPLILKYGALKIGLGVCYDLRFAELAEIYVQSGCHLLTYPAAFNMTTGPAHWLLLARARAVQSQCYVALCSPARDTTAGYVTWGHSLVVDPWGEVVASTDEHEDIIYADIDLNRLDEVRNMIPLRKQRRMDIYDTVCRVQPLIVE